MNTEFFKQIDFSKIEDKDSLSEAFGITQERAEELHHLQQKEFENNDNKSWGEMLESLKKECKIDAEFVYLLFDSGYRFSRFQMANINPILSSLLGI